MKLAILKTFTGLSFFLAVANGTNGEPGWCITFAVIMVIGIAALCLLRFARPKKRTHLEPIDWLDY